ncbi:MAG: hypothetical protein RIG63_15360 [Coleofasciculus chthonoplastes F3-SA18-01]|jgi:hypothetical protein|uniref:hypothetical protein n=1 Tax=Coleofasciculus chthonoplastes TaxID=64178 RepID=UPI0033000D23
MKKDNKAFYFEQYFTKLHVAQDSVQIILADLKENLNIDVFGDPKIHLIEPSCGEGVFVKELNKKATNLRITSLDIDTIFEEAITDDFLRADPKILNIKPEENLVFFGCPPSDLTKEFLLHCKETYRSATQRCIFC